MKTTVDVRLSVRKLQRLLLGLGVAKVSASMLYGISPIDPVSTVVTVILLGTASLLASTIPARRAAKVDPMEALRCE